MLSAYFNSTKVQFGAMAAFEPVTSFVNFNSTKVQFGVPHYKKGRKLFFISIPLRYNLEEKVIKGGELRLTFQFH